MMKWILLLVPALAFAQTGNFLEDGWTPDYCQRTGVAVPSDAVISGYIAEMHRGDSQAVNTACGTDMTQPEGWVTGCAIKINENGWVIWFTNDCSWQHEQCHAIYQIHEHTKYRSVERERWLLGCEKINPKG